MAQRIAQPPKAPDPPKAAPVVGRVFSTKEQEDFNAEADALAAKLGWSGPADNLLFDIRVEDAQNYLRKTFHEVHQSALTPERDTPEAAAVCEHLGLKDKDDLATVEAAITAAYEREVKDAPKNPTSLPGTTRVASMSAALEGNVSEIIGSGSGGKQ
jgi:hypothetical protein